MAQQWGPHLPHCSQTYAWISSLIKVKKIETQPVQLYRYVDDCFATFEKRAHITEFYNILILIHPNIQFTYELAQNNHIGFLGCYGLAIKMEN